MRIAKLLDLGEMSVGLSEDPEEQRGIEPARAARFHELATKLWRSGDEDAALMAFSWGLISNPEFPHPAALPDADVGGPWYLRRLSEVHRLLKPRTYLEIGVDRGHSFCRALAETVSIGVDPNPSPEIPAAPNRRIFAATSDDFFASQDVPALLGRIPLDLAFVDGMHRFEYAVRDFMNLERISTPRTTILVHDCYPLTRASAERERATVFWSGDVWRLVLLLRKYRPDLSVHTVAIPPTGLAIIRGLDPESLSLERHGPEWVEEFLALDYSFLEGRKHALLNRVPNDWARIHSLLRAT